MLSLVDITLRAILPVFYATPIHYGGLGLEPSQIGNILSVYGIANGILQIFFFAPVQQRWGAKNVFIAGLVSVVPVFALFPVVNALARMHYGMTPLVWTMVFVQIGMSILINLSYGEKIYLYF
jgi:MFS family permease